MINFTIENYITEKVRVMHLLDHDAINTAINRIDSVYKNGGKIITCGNGGSASTASHFITDWNKMVNLLGGGKFRGFCLNDNIGLITAYANDVNYDSVFSGQLESILDENDLLIGVSGSGNSNNVINAIEYANKLGADTLGLVGYDGGKISKMVNNCVHVPSFDMQICEDLHLMFGHFVMKSLCGCSLAIEGDVTGAY